MSFRSNDLGALTEATNVLKGIYGHGVAKMVLKSQEIRSAPSIVIRWREIGRQPEFDVFGVVSKEKRVNIIKEVADPMHIELLRGLNGVYVLAEGTAVVIEQSPVGFIIVGIVCLESLPTRKIRID